MKHTRVCALCMRAHGTATHKRVFHSPLPPGEGFGWGSLRALHCDRGSPMLTLRLALEDQPNAAADYLEDNGAEVPNQAAVWEESEAGKYQLPDDKE